MNETFIFHCADGAPVAEALGVRLERTGIPAWLHRGGGSADGLDETAIHAQIDRASHVVLVVTPDWTVASWPIIEHYLASTPNSPAAFLAKLVLVDLSNGTSVPAPLRPLLKSGFGTRAFDPASIVAAVAASAGLVPPEGVVSPSRGEVFVLGHPGSGKSAFCGRLTARLAQHGLAAVKIDAYSYLQTLFRIDQLRRNATRFAPDPLCEFVIRDGAVLDESVMLVRRRLLSRKTLADGATIVELAFSEGKALADVLDACPGGIIVHVDASLDACTRRNASRGAILERTLQAAASSSEGFDRDSDVHYVPPRYYDRFLSDPSLWEDGPAFLARRFGCGHHRLENEHDDVQAYMAACDRLIETILLPRLDREA